MHSEHVHIFLRCWFWEVTKAKDKYKLVEVTLNHAYLIVFIQALNTCFSEFFLHTRPCVKRWPDTSILDPVVICSSANSPDQKRQYVLQVRNLAFSCDSYLFYLKNAIFVSNKIILAHNLRMFCLSAPLWRRCHSHRSTQTRNHTTWNWLGFFHAFLLSVQPAINRISNLK